MAYVKTWSTKEEVLKDLARASGRSFKKKEVLDEGYLVIGDAPPPVIPEDEDDEMHILFGDAASRKANHIEEENTPDLAGIQQMLRMMQEFNSGDDDDNNDPATSKDCGIAISKVSTLNPNVEEFVPRASRSSSTNSNKNSNSPSRNHFRNDNVISPRKSMFRNRNITSKSTSNINPVVVEQIVDAITEDSSNKKPEVSNNVSLDTKVDTVKEKELQDIATTLKNAISVAAKSDCFELKKQKNVAIATLLRLYAQNSTSPKKSTEPLKLCTPEYFEGKKEEKVEDKLDENIKILAKEPLDISPSTSSTTPEPKDTTTTLASNSSISISSTPVETTPKVKLDPEIKKSIDKVNRWLEEPTKRKSPAVCLGPIPFKRKEPVNCKSPVSDTAPKPKVSNDRQYKPSKYATDLGKQYLERSKIIESKKKEITWSNLEDVLKEKDSIVIRKRLEEQNSTSASASDTC